MKNKPLSLRIHNNIRRLTRNFTIGFMRCLGYGCENCKHCDPVCYYAGEVSGANFWCKDWEGD